jgi:hypothetical protein
MKSEQFMNAIASADMRIGVGMTLISLAHHLLPIHSNGSGTLVSMPLR